MRTLHALERRGADTLRGRLEPALDDLEAVGDLEGARWLDRLVRAVDDEAALHAGGRAVMARTLERIVRQRRLLTPWDRSTPHGVRAPIFIVGLARTGTTFLHHQLARRAPVRVLRFWESMEPAFRTLATPRAALIAKHAVHLSALRLVDPTLMRMHDVRVLGPEECSGLLKITLRTEQFFATLDVPAYLERVRAEDDGAAYRMHARMLDAIDPRPRGPWLLKSPFYLLGLRSLLAVYPDARFVVTQRDEARALPSRVELIRRLRGLLSDVDATRVARDVSAWTERAIAMSQPILDAMPDSARIVVRAESLFAEPERELARITEWIAR